MKATCHPMAPYVTHKKNVNGLGNFPQHIRAFASYNGSHNLAHGPLKAIPLQSASCIAYANK